MTHMVAHALWYKQIADRAGRTEIWATVVKRVGNTYVRETGWVFNTLTYLPFMTRSQWANNPLGRTAEWTAADDAKWKTGCDTPASGKDACRS